jgi:ubiquinone/menaquinone biosynthesis C-methylase UbiE
LNKVIDAFDKAAQSYDSWYSHPQGRQILEAEVKTINKMIPQKGIGLEIGSGTGIFAESLGRTERPIICLDPSKEMLSRAVGRSKYNVLGSGEQIPLRSAIDFTYMVAVIEFLEDPIRVFMEVKQATGEGSLIILFINADSTWGMFYKELGLKGDPVFRHAKLYNLENVVRLLQDSGYKIQKMIGTLTSGPMDKYVGGEIAAPDNSAGVIVLKAIS